MSDHRDDRDDAPGAARDPGAGASPAAAAAPARDSGADASSASDPGEPVALDQGVARDSDPADSTDSTDDAERDSLPPALPARAVLPLALVLTVAVALALRYAFAAEQAGSWQMLAALFGVYAPFAALAVVLIGREGKVAFELRPRKGDLSFGAIVAALMYAVAMAGRQLFMGADSPRSWWVARIYLQLGDRSDNRMLYVGAAVFVIAVLEEIVWRGLVMRSLRKPLGPMRAWLVSSALYAVAHVTTLQLLAHPVAGLNPLLVAASLGCGLVWGHLYNRTGRLAPCLFAHGLFSWAIVDFPLWRP